MTAVKHRWSISLTATMVVSSGTNANPFAKEMSIRRRIASIFNKREDDFASLREYNDYLEEVEDMTFNLIEGIDVPAIEAKIAQYERENAEQIIISRARKAEELAAALRASREPVSQTDGNDASAAQSSQVGGNSLTGQGHYAPTAHPGGGLVQPRPTGMVPQPHPVGSGMLDPMLGHGLDDEETLRLKAERGARAGGWTLELSKRRAFEEAFSSLWL